MKDIAGAFLIGAFLLVVIVALVLVMNTFVEKGKCVELSRLGVENDYRWSFWLGCLVQSPDGVWHDAIGWPIR